MKTPTNAKECIDIVINEILNTKKHEEEDIALLLPLVQEIKNEVLPSLTKIHNDNTQALNETAVNEHMRALDAGWRIGERYSDIRVLKHGAKMHQIPSNNITKEYYTTINCTSNDYANDVKNKSFIIAEDDIIFVPRNNNNNNNNNNDMTNMKHKVNFGPNDCIVMCPWGGSKRKQYWPHIHYYTNALGINVFAFNMPMIASSKKREEYVLNLYDVLQNYKLRNHCNNIYIHNFSMNGAWLTARLALVDSIIFNNNSNNNNNDYQSLIHIIRSIVNDSCPAFRGRNQNTNNEQKELHYAEVLRGSSAAYMPSIVGKVQYNRPILAELFMAGAVVNMTLECMEGRQHPNDIDDQSINDILYYEFPKQYHHVPQLFLYSDGDMLIRPNFVEAFVNHITKSYGVKTYKHFFNKSPHCMHFRRFPEEYGNTLDQFYGANVESSSISSSKNMHTKNYSKL